MENYSFKRRDRNHGEWPPLSMFSRLLHPIYPVYTSFRWLSHTLQPICKLAGRNSASGLATRFKLLVAVSCSYSVHNSYHICIFNQRKQSLSANISCNNETLKPHGKITNLLFAGLSFLAVYLFNISTSKWSYGKEPLQRSWRRMVMKGKKHKMERWKLSSGFA